MNRSPLGGARYCSVLLSLLSIASLSARDMYHFYRTPIFFHTTRFEKPGLTSFDVSAATGGTEKSRTKGMSSAGGCCDATSSLLNIYGPHNMAQLGACVPGKDNTVAEDLMLINLANIRDRATFGQLQFFGKLKLNEYHFTFTQNINCGFFIEADVPLRRFDLSCVQYADLSPLDGALPNVSTPEWQAFLNNFTAILKRYDLAINDYTKTGVGDLAVALGWSSNYEKTDCLDFIDLTLKAGVIVPTSKKQDLSNPFALPFGYNGHTGFALSVDAAFGCYDWLTIGGNISTIIFNHKEQTVRLKTSAAQNGFIKLARGQAEVEKGTIWHGCGYLLADHLCHGFSGIVGYSLTHQKDTMLDLCDTQMFSQSVVNTDEQLKSWTMHTLHFLVEYDIATDSRLTPRIGAFYNLQVGGTRVFKLSTGGGTFGFDLSWCF